MAIAAARSLQPGVKVTVEGVVTAEAGRIGLPLQVAIQDATGAIVVKLTERAARPARGTVIRVTGKLAAPFGQLEVRPASASSVSIVGPAALPDPLPGSASTLGEATEARLVVIEGRLEAPIAREAGGDLVLRLVDDGGVAFRARATRASGIEAAAALPGTRLRLTGTVGQRASRKGALDGYRLWLRDAADLAITALPSPPAPSASPSNPPGAAVQPIAAVLRLDRGSVRVDGIVTIPAALLDASGRRLIVQDASAAIEVLLPTGSAAPRPGTRLLIDGEIGTAYGVPRIRAVAVQHLGTAAIPAPHALAGEPGSADEGELVRIAGRVLDIRRTGDRWRAEVATAGGTIVVAGLAGARIAATAVPEGASAIVVGVVRRPHPAATDRRFAVVPRGPGDIHVSAAPLVAAGAPHARGGSTPRPGALPAGSAPVSAAPAIDADLAKLGDLAGARVRVGGLVAALDGDIVVVDDGTATAGLRLTGDAAAALPLLEAGDAVSAVGRVVVSATRTVVEVDDPAGLARLGDLGETLPLDPPEQVPADETDPGPAASDPPPVGIAGLPGGALDRASTAEESGDGPLLAGMGLTLLASGAWASLATLQRRRSRRRLASRIAARLAALAAQGPAAAPRPRVAAVVAPRTPGRPRPGSVAPAVGPAPAPPRHGGADEHGPDEHDPA